MVETEDDISDEKVVVMVETMKSTEEEEAQ